MFLMQPLKENPSTHLFESLRLAFDFCQKNSLKIGNHGYLLPVEQFFLFEQIQSFYLKHQNSLSPLLHFWKTDATLEEFLPHVDSPDINVSQYSILFGLLNCTKNVSTDFHIPQNKSPKIIHSNDIYFLDPEEPRAIHSFFAENNKAYLLNGSIWHGVINKTKQTRVVASWWLKPDMREEELFMEFSLVPS